MSISCNWRQQCYPATWTTKEDTRFAYLQVPCPRRLHSINPVVLNCGIVFHSIAMPFSFVYYSRAQTVSQGEFAHKRLSAYLRLRTRRTLQLKSQQSATGVKPVRATRGPQRLTANLNLMLLSIRQSFGPGRAEGQFVHPPTRNGSRAHLVRSRERSRLSSERLQARNHLRC